jgi:exosortase E/protease (VPEID-CTERM system)
MGWPVRLAVVLALGEPLLLGFQFDATNLLSRGHAGLALASAGYVLTLLAGVATAMAVLVCLRPRELDLVAAELAEYRPPWLLWGVHAAAFGALFAVTQKLFGRTGDTLIIDPRPIGWGPVAAWVAAALVDLGTLVRCVLPFPAWGRLARRTARTIALGAAAGTSAWVLGLASERAWLPLSDVTLGLVARVLMAVEPEVVFDREQALIGTPRFAVTIAPMCSGFAGMTLVCVFVALLLIAAWNQLRVGRVALLLPLSVVVAWTANSLRIAALVVIGAHGSPRIALGGFHSKAGWFFFCLVAFGLVVVIRRVPWFLREPPAAHERTYSPTVAYLTPLAMQLGVAMLTGMFALHVDRAYGLRVVAVAGVFVALRRVLPRPEIDLHWMPLSLGVAAYIVWIALAPASDPQAVLSGRAELATLGSAGFFVWVALRVLGSVALVPVAEELAFRGFLLPRMMASDFLEVPPRKLTVLSLVVSSVAFGLLHEHWWIPATLCGVLYAFARQRRGRLSDAILAHATTNLLVAADVLLRHSWSLWL